MKVLFRFGLGILIVGALGCAGMGTATQAAVGGGIIGSGIGQVFGGLLSNSSNTNEKKLSSHERQLANQRVEIQELRKSLDSDGVPQGASSGISAGNTKSEGKDLFDLDENRPLNQDRWLKKN